MLITDVILLLNPIPGWIRPFTLKALDLFASLAAFLYPIFLPLWPSVRLSPLDKESSKLTVLQYVKFEVALFLSILLSISLIYGPLFYPFRMTFSPTASILDTGLLTSGLLQTVWVIIVFTTVRGLIELINRIPGQRDLNWQVPGVLKDRSPYYNILTVATVFALALWFSSAIFSTYPDSAYIAPFYKIQSILGLPMSVTSPLERPPVAIWLLMFTSLGMLLVTLFLSIYTRPDEPSARLLALLGLLYGISGIEIFPEWGVDHRHPRWSQC